MVLLTPGHNCLPPCCDPDCAPVEIDADGGDRDWPNIFYVASADCNQPVITIPPTYVAECADITDNLCSDCEKYSTSLCPGQLIKLVAFGSPVTGWKTAETTSCTSGPVWELEAPASYPGTWKLYAGGKTSPSATYSSTKAPHRFFTPAWITCDDNGDPQAGVCGEFTLDSSNSDCSGWPDMIAVFGCFCDDKTMCEVCNDCDYDEAQYDACCNPIVRITQQPTNFSGCTISAQSVANCPADLFIWGFNTFYEDAGSIYRACRWNGVLPTQFGNTFSYVYLIYNEATDQYKIILIQGSSSIFDPFPGVDHVFESSWFSRVSPCRDIGERTLTYVSGRTSCPDPSLPSTMKVNFENPDPPCNLNCQNHFGNRCEVTPWYFSGSSGTGINGDEAWTNHANIKADDGSDASATNVSDTETTEYLQAIDFSAIPDGELADADVICGIEVEFEIGHDGGGFSIAYVDDVIIGTTNVKEGTSETFRPPLLIPVGAKTKLLVGGKYDKFGKASLTGADIKTATRMFGIQCSHPNVGQNFQFDVDYIKVRFYKEV